MRRNPVWFHAGAPCNGCSGIGQMYDALEAAGIPFGVYSVKGGGLVAEAVRYSMAQTIIYRDLAYDYVPYHVDPAAGKAKEYWRQMRDALPPEVRAAKDRIWLEVFNEPDKERTEDVAKWQYLLAVEALADGYRFCGPGWASGTPEPAAWRGAWMRKYLMLCAEYPERVAVTLHEYSYDAADIASGYPYLVGRYRYLFAACDDLGIARPTIFITETGWTLNDMPAMTDDILADVAFLAREYAAHPQIRAAFLWSLIGGGDKKMLAQRLNALIAPLTDYAKTARFDGEPTPKPTPPTPTPEPEPEPAVNLLPNAGWEGGHYHPNDTNGHPIMALQVPNGWTINYRETTADGGWPNPFGGAPFLRPEMNRLPEYKLAADEKKGQEDALILEGEHTLKLFKGGAPIYATLIATIPAAHAGRRLRLVVPIFPDLVKGYTPKPEQAKIWADDKQGRDGLFRIRRNADILTTGRPEWAGVYGGGWVALVPGRWQTVEVEFDAPASGFDLKLDFLLPFGLPQNGVFMDDLRLHEVVVAPPPPPDPKPEPPPPPPPDRPVLVLDISKWQGIIDPARMKAAGVDGVMLRASYATNTGSRPDEKADEFAASLAAAGIPFGWYHYFHPARPVGEQFSVFKSVVEQYGYKLRLALDLEEKHGVDSATAGKAGEFMLLVQGAFPIQGKHLIYTSLGYWRDTLKIPAWGANYDLWIAAWTDAAAPIPPTPWKSWVLWQHTSNGDGPSHGVGSARLDLNRFNGDRAAFSRWMAQSATQPPSVEPLANALWERGLNEPSLTWNPNFSLAASILKDGWHIVSGEYDFAHDGRFYRCQNAADNNGKRRVYYCRIPHWSEVHWIAGPSTTPPTPKPPVTPPTPVPPTTPTGTVINLERAFRPIAVADGQEARGPFMVYQHDDGRTEDAQYLVKDGHTYLIKGSNYEHMQVLGNDIYRFEDTSHGDDTYYTLRDSDQLYGSVWLPREMKIGRPFRREPWVTFFRKSNCTIYAGPDRHETWAVIDRHMAQATLPGGLKVTSVIDLYVGKTEDARSTWFERYWYALGTAGADGRIEVRGLVQWWARNDQGDIVAHSWLVDLPKGRPPLPLVKPKCFQEAR